MYSADDRSGPGVHGLIWFLKSTLEAFYERSVGFVISNLKPGTSLEAVREWLFVARILLLSLTLNGEL
jgi:hypothetical protein